MGGRQVRNGFRGRVGTGRVARSEKHRTKCSQKGPEGTRIVLSKGHGPICPVGRSLDPPDRPRAKRGTAAVTHFHFTTWHSKVEREGRSRRPDMVTRSKQSGQKARERESWGRVTDSPYYKTGDATCDSVSSRTLL